ncbi:MAG: phosphatase PAP2 family protein [Desulfonauticus sp.]|nr:phosphatase PAP2 family protein [Desulfonauticus sp.]
MDKKELKSFFLFSLPILVVLSLLFFLGPENNYLFFKKFSTSHPNLTLFFKFISNYGNPLFYLVYLYFLVTGVKQHKKELIYLSLFYLVVQLSISFLGVRILKIVFARERPELGSAFTFFSFAAVKNSFPSGHTTEIYGATLPLVLIKKTPYISLGLGLLAATLGFSRIYLGQHHPSDVLAGYILGSMAGYTIFYLWSKTVRKKRPIFKLNTFIEFITSYPLLTLTIIYWSNFIFSLNTRALWFSDEVRYANVFENVLKAKKWLVLYLNGQPYPDKPPLYFWFLSVLSYFTHLNDKTILFLGTAISGFIYICLTYFLGKYILKDKKRAFLATCLLLSNFYFLALIHYIRMDLLFASFILASHLMLYFYFETKQTKYIYLTFFLSFLALLTKGPLGVVFPLLTFITFACLQKEFKLLINKQVGLALGCLLLGIFIWLSAIYWVEGKEFIYNLLYKQTYKRAVHTWHHPHPFYYYFLIFPLVILPWSLAITKIKLSSNFSKDEKFLLCFFGSGFIGLSLVSIKIAIYLLPLFAPFFLLFSRTFNSESPMLAKILGYFFLAIGIILPVLNFFPQVPCKAINYIWIFGIMLIALGTLLLKTTPPKKHLPIVLSLLCPLIFIYTARYLAPHLDPIMSPKEQAQIIKQYIKKGYKPLAYKVYSGIYTYYAGSNIEETNDFNQVQKKLEQNYPILLIIPEKYFNRFKKQLSNLKVVDKHKIVEKNYYLLLK